ncbi:MAG: Uma2 family endonuclease [Chloroflexi bacterium]|nr:MAG: Uma2 family endonuclease [Chloroflexota bacterium]
MATVVATPTTQAKFSEKVRPIRGHWRSSDLELLPDNGTQYEIINGELYMSKSPHWRHQAACTKVAAKLTLWSESSGSGEAVINPGIIFTDANDVIPDVVWISNERLGALMDDAGHLTGAPELVIEALSFGPRNEERDRTAKRKLYETQGVREYWILDWRLKQVELYRRERGELRLVATLLPEDTVTSPLLPGFACVVSDLFS